MENKRIVKNLLLAILFLAFAFGGVKIVSAAVFYLEADKSNFAVGDEFYATVKIDSEDVEINAAQITIQFPNDMLEVIHIDKSDSIFNFWLEEPSFSNDIGEIVFTGGSNTAISGQSLNVLGISFLTKETGNANIVLTNGVITAGDGTGINVLNLTRGLEILVSPRTEITGGAPSSSPPQIPSTTSVAPQNKIVQSSNKTLPQPINSLKIFGKNIPVIQIREGVKLNAINAILLLLTAVAMGFLGGMFIFRARQKKKINLRVLMVQNDLARVFRLINEGIRKLYAARKTPTTADDDFIIDKLKEESEKMEEYMEKEIGKIKE